MIVDGMESGTAPLDSCERLGEIWSTICSAFLSAMTFSDRRNESENGGFPVTRSAARGQFPDPPHKSCHSLRMRLSAPFTVHSVANKFVEERHVLK